MFEHTQVQIVNLFPWGERLVIPKSLRINLGKITKVRLLTLCKWNVIIHREREP